MRAEGYFAAPRWEQWEFQAWRTEARRHRASISAMIQKKRVRVADVAKLAGCSPATVSRAINSPEKVRPPVVARVLAAVEQLDYTPNNAARALRSRRTRIFGAVIPTLNHAIYAREIQALEEGLGQAGYSLLVTTSEYDPAREFRQSRILLERGAEGIVLVGDSHDPRLHELLHAHGVPCVNTYVFDPDSGHPCVGFDNRKAARQAIEFLLTLGHRDIAVISGITRYNDRQQQRLQGVRATLAARGLSIAGHRIVEEPYSIDAGYEGMRRILLHGAPPTAVFCFSDILAVGALAYCGDVGLNVPHELSIIGFDNLEYAIHVRPALTTLEVPAAEMGSRAATYLVERLQGIRGRDFWELETKLIVRASTHSPPTAKPSTQIFASRAAT